MVPDPICSTVTSIPTSYIIHAVTWRVCSLVAGMFAQEGQTSFPSSARDNRHHKECSLGAIERV
uniref:Uncharacterized protein n=1 Tax=Magallana gigas TaxID=29159 RepID=K1QPN7_MAGGI